MNEIKDFISDLKDQKPMPSAEQREFLEIIRTPPEGIKIVDGDWVLTAAQQNARGEFIARNSRLAVYFTKRWCKVSDPRFIDLVSAAIEGMINALDNFDLTKDVKFSTYAYFWVRARVFSELKISDPDTRQYKSLNDKYKKEKNTHLKEGVHLTDAEIYRNLEWDETTVMRFEVDSARLSIDIDSVDSLDPKVQQDEALLSEDECEQILHKICLDEDVGTLHDALNRLPSIQAMIIRRHYGMTSDIAETYDVLAEELNMPREKVRQQENIGLRLLWLYFEDRDLFEHALLKYKRGINL